MEFIKKYGIIVIDSIFAGIMIAIGAIIFLNCANPIVGALLFSIGLITIMIFGFNLYTGKVGYARQWKDIPTLLLILFMNLVGCLFILLFPTTGAAALVGVKLAVPLFAVFIKAIVCGIIIFICVQNKNDIRITILGIPAFILCGAEHSIADACFIFAAGAFSLETLVFLAIVALGNAVGSLAISLWLSYKNKEER